MLDEMRKQRKEAIERLHQIEMENREKEVWGNP